MNDLPPEYERALDRQGARARDVRPLLFRAELVDRLRRLEHTAGDKATARVLTEAADMLSRDGHIYEHLAGIVRQARH